VIIESSDLNKVSVGWVGIGIGDWWGATSHLVLCKGRMEVLFQFIA